jgi:hypothetical protein
MSKINDDTNAPMGSGTTRGWKGWPSGPASKERFTHQGYPTSRRLTGERQAASDAENRRKLAQLLLTCVQRRCRNSAMTFRAAGSRILWLT